MLPTSSTAPLEATPKGRTSRDDFKQLVFLEILCEHQINFSDWGFLSHPVPTNRGEGTHLLLLIRVNKTVSPKTHRLICIGMLILLGQVQEFCSVTCSSTVSKSQSSGRTQQHEGHTKPQPALQETCSRAAAASRPLSCHPETCAP